jgi:hypothetical protein
MATYSRVMDVFYQRLASSFIATMQGTQMNSLGVEPG